MPRRVAEPHPTSRLHVLCPFCGTACDRTASLAWCAKCYVEYTLRRDGTVVFDTNKRTERFAFAKAVMKAGGLGLAAAGGGGEEDG